jgi:hypothetical protein
VEADGRAEAESARLRLQGRPFVPVPHDAEADLGPPFEQPARGQQERGAVLDRRQASDEAHERRVRREAGLRAQAAPRQVPRERVELEPQRNHANACARSDAQRGQVVAHRIGDGHERAGEGAQRPLDNADDGAGGGAEVAAQDVAVVRVDHHRHACGERGQTSQDAGLGRVGVHDVRADAAQEPPETDEGAEISQRSDVAPEPGKGEDVHTSRKRQIQQAPFTPRLAADHEPGLVAQRREAHRQVDDVEGGSAHVQPREDPDDPDLRPAIRGKRNTHLRAGSTRITG